MKLPEKITVPIEQVKPYESNPRKITEKAVDAVASSIEEFGNVQPIVVDMDDVVIAGHTRLRALKKLGRTHVDIYRVELSESAARRYRLVDNRTHELTEWNHEKLVAELRERESSMLMEYFPDIDLQVGSVTAVSVSEKDVMKGLEEATKIRQANESPMAGVECPSCSKEFKVRADSLHVLTPEDVQEMLMQE